MNDKGYDDRPVQGLSDAELLKQALQVRHSAGYYAGVMEQGGKRATYQLLLTEAIARRDACFGELARRLAIYRKMADACRKLLHYRERNTLNWQLEKADDFHRLIGLALDELETTDG